MNLGTCLQFNGTNQYATIPDLDAYSITTTGELTVSIFIKPDTDNFTATTGTNYVNFFGKTEYSPTNTEWQFRIYNTNNTETNNRNNEISFYVFNSGGSTGVSGDAPQSRYNYNRFISLIGVIKNGKVSMYRDGVLWEKADYATTVTAANTVAKLWLGTADTTSFFKGTIGPIKIWNRALTEGEIVQQAYYNSSNTSGLVGHWIADSSNNRLSDQTANTNHGTLFNSPTFVSNVNVTTMPLPFGRNIYSIPTTAVTLNGTNQFLSIADASQTNLDLGTNDFIIATRFKTSTLAAIQTIFCKFNTTSTSLSTANAIGFDCIYNTGSGGQLQFRFNDGSASAQTVSVNANFLADGNYHDVAIVVDRNQTLQIWIDCILIGSGNAAARQGSLSSDGPFVVGTRRAADSWFLKGLIDYLYVYSWTAGSLPTDYIQIVEDLFRNKTTTYTNGLVSKWDFVSDGTDGNGANTLAGTNTPTYSTTSISRSAVSTRTIASTRS